MGSPTTKKEIKRKGTLKAQPARKKSHERSISESLSDAIRKFAISMFFIFGFLLCIGMMPILKPKEEINTLDFDPAKVIQISWKRRLFLYKGFLSDEECDHLIELDETVARIEERIAKCNYFLKKMQILRYECGQKYEPHYDFFVDKKNQKPAGGGVGHRLATVPMYLTDVELGGKTIFPNTQFEHLQFKDNTWSDFAKGGLSVKSVKGYTVLFFNLNPDGTADPNGLHGSCPVIDGEKWSAPKWIHVGSYDDLSYTAPNNC